MCAGDSPTLGSGANATGPTEWRAQSPVAHEFRDIDVYTTRRSDPVIERRLAERRFRELANAVREHEASFGRQLHGRRREDGRLYQRLRQISGEPPRSAQNQREDDLT